MTHMTSYDYLHLHKLYLEQWNPTKSGLKNATKLLFEMVLLDTFLLRKNPSEAPHLCSEEPCGLSHRPAPRRRLVTWGLKPTKLVVKPGRMKVTPAERRFKLAKIRVKPWSNQHLGSRQQIVGFTDAKRFDQQKIRGFTKKK